MAQRAAWVVMLRGFPGPHEEDEVAAVFLNRTDALGYARWWNREEAIRYGPRSPVTAVPEEIDFYAPGAWQPPARRRALRAADVAGG